MPVLAPMKDQQTAVDKGDPEAALLAAAEPMSHQVKAGDNS